MPTSLHPQAKFDPIPPDLDLSSLVDHTPNLKWVQRVSRDQIRNLGQREFEKVALMHVLIGGKPLVIGGWDAVLPESLFNANWFEKAYDKKGMSDSPPDLAAANSSVRGERPRSWLCERSTYDNRPLPAIHEDIVKAMDDAELPR